MKNKNILARTRKNREEPTTEPNHGLEMIKAIDH